MDINEKQISEIVKEVVTQLENENKTNDIALANSGGILFSTMEEAIACAKNAQNELQNLDLELRKNIINAMREVGRNEAESLAKMANSETGMGRWKDKIIKNRLAADKTPGIEDLQPVSYTGDNGLTLVERAPYGVIGAVTPSTNPPSTIINNSISIIAAGNSVVFAPHPASKEVSQITIKLLSEAIVKAGGPSGLITAMEKPTIEGAQVLFKHPDIKVLLVTGGPAVVRAAMKSEKRVIAAGPGNPPVVIDETAEPAKAVDAIVNGASFDNGILCTAEKEVLMTDSCASNIINKMRSDQRAYELSSEQMDELTSIVIKEGGVGCSEPVLNRDYVGKNASVIAKAIGLNIDDDIRLLWGVVDENHPLMWTEQLMPVLPFAKTGDIERTIDIAVKMEGGNGHTAIMHSLNVDNLTKMAKRAACSIFVKNGSSYMGLGMGEGFASLSIATPTGDGLVSARTFTRPLRCTLVDYFRIV
jgi:propionaldehyde dehydrogenase